MWAMGSSYGAVSRQEVRLSWAI
uniref:Uncharacterized protein n=1 Tax=Rhizophora mucronata TaxID=61149 RepID=A0A2P2PQF3_RHIMU